MSHLEVLKTPAKVTAIAVAGVVGFNALKDLIPNPFSPPRGDAQQFESKSTLTDLRNAEDVILAKGAGNTSTTIDGQLKYTGWRAKLGANSLIPGRNLDTTVTTNGELQIVVSANGIVEDPNNDQNNGPFKVSVDLSKVYSQIVPIGPTKTVTNKGKFVKLREVIHDNESKQNETGDALENYGRTSFINKCQGETMQIFDPGVKNWVKDQEEVKPGRKIVVSYLNSQSDRINLSDFALPKKPIASPDDLVTNLYDNDQLEIEKILDPPCIITPKVANQINTLNGRPENPGV